MSVSRPPRGSAHHTTPTGKRKSVAVDIASLTPDPYPAAHSRPTERWVRGGGGGLTHSVCQKCSDSERAWALFDQMRRLEISPTLTTYGVLIAACGQVSFLG
jgi:pentatricopeptide repeat protein